MSTGNLPVPAGFHDLLTEVKARIQQSQTRAIFAANSELLGPEVKGFSERNIKRMLAFYRAYLDPSAVSPRLLAKLPHPTAKSQRTVIVPQAVAQLVLAKKCHRRWHNCRTRSFGRFRGRVTSSPWRKSRI